MENSERRLRARIKRLRSQEAALLEEVGQLKAAVHIYKELALRLAAGIESGKVSMEQRRVP